MALSGRMLRKCFASVVFPEHVAPLCWISHARSAHAIATHPMPTKITRGLRLASDILAEVVTGRGKEVGTAATAAVVGDDERYRSLGSSTSCNCILTRLAKADNYGFILSRASRRGACHCAS
jgi:acetyl-CoA carboxylase alpha subunit